MNNERLIILLTRKMAGEITLVEEAELRDLIIEQPESVYYEEFLHELWLKKKEKESEINHAFEKHKRRHQGKIDFEEGYPLFITEEEESETPFWSAKMRVYACVAVLFMVTCLVLFNSMPYAEPDPNSTMMEIVAEKGIRKKIILPDGTHVWLNANSKLLYTDFSKNTMERLVELQGEAYFDVFHDSKRPFYIKTNDISIKVLGTAFNVKAYPEDKKTETTLIRGAIEMSLNARPNEKILLKPNEKVALTNNSKQEEDGDPNTADITLTIGSLSTVNIGNHEYVKEISWMENQLIFKEERMDELIPKLERWYNIKIKVEDDKIRAYKYTGNVNKETIHQLFGAMQLIKPFNFKIINDEIILY